MTEKVQILDMVRSGTISEAEGQRLIDALGARHSAWRAVVDPFDRLSTSAGWALAVVICAACLAVSQLGFRFDGALDIHVAPRVPPWRIAFIDAANAIGITSIVLWLASLAVSRRGRFGDFVLAVSIARAPLVLMALLVYGMFPPPKELSAQVAAATLNPGVLISGLLTLPLFVWFVTLLYRGFVYASGMKGATAGVTFTVAVMIGELLTKLVLLGIVRLR